LFMPLNNLVEKIVDVVTGDEIIRPYTDNEIALVETEKAKIAAWQNAKDAEQATKDAARQAVLDKLGLSTDEVAALLG
jgi:hypothetical protein